MKIKSLLSKFLQRFKRPQKTVYIHAEYDAHYAYDILEDKHLIQITGKLKTDMLRVIFEAPDEKCAKFFCQEFNPQMAAIENHAKKLMDKKDV